MKQPDLFERMVKERMEIDGGIWSDTAVDLLRREHAWVVRMVKEHDKAYRYMPGGTVTFAILQELRERRK
jgi:predicted acylesterase/phospholipase RssA